MSGWIELGSACVLVASTTTVEPTANGWREQVRYELLSQGGCQQSALHFEPGVRWTELGGKRRLADATGGKLGADRFAIRPAARDGSATVSVHLPEMLSGDRAILELVREWEAVGSYRWRPHRDGARWAELDAGKEASFVHFGEVEVERKRGTAWVAEPTAADEVQVLSTRTLPEPAPPEVGTAGLSVDEALAKMAGLKLQPRALEAEQPVAGDAALARGIVDDRGWARTLVALTAGGPDTVELGYRMPDNARPAAIEDALAELAVHRTEAGARVLAHPTTPSWQGNVHTQTTHQQMSWTQQAEPEPGEPLVLNRELSLSWSGDPAYELAPGRSSRVDAVDELAVPEGRAAIRVVPTPPVAGPATVSGEGVRALARPGSTLLAVDAGPARTITLTWGHPDAPTYGERPSFADLTVDQQVRADGKVRWEEGAWWLASAEGTPILPSREALLRALEYRFGVAAYPQPGLAVGLRGRGAGWEVAEDLRDGLRERAQVGELARDTLMPRKLMKARRSGILTPLEATLLAMHWANELGMQATWTLVRPAPAGPGATVSPAGYTHALLRIAHDGEQRWMDLACTVCAPWELPPDAEGADALGWEVGESPAPTPGTLIAEATADGHRYTLSASAALSLRLALVDELGPERSARIVDSLSVGGTLTEVDGLAEAGAPVTVTIAGGEPRHWPEGEWMGWVGTRQWPSAGPDARYEGEAVTWERTTEDGLTVEVLTVRERRVGEAERAAVEAARTAVPEPEPEEQAEPAEEGEAEVEAEVEGVSPPE